MGKWRLRQMLGQMLAHPGYYFGREVVPLGQAMGVVPAERRWRAGESLAEFLARLSLATFDQGRGFLVEKPRLGELLVGLRAWAEADQASAYVRPEGGVPALIGPRTRLAPLLLELRRAALFSIWASGPSGAHRLRVEALRSPRHHFRNAARRALARDIPKASSERLFADYERRWADSTMNFTAPVDVVFTWVDSDDPRFRAAWNDHAGGRILDPDRYKDSGELRFALRSVFYNLPWVRQVFVVSNCSAPAWLNEEKIRFVSHEEILPAHALPTFNSHVIESALHRIPGLAEHFVYLNDDMFINEVCDAGQFFTSEGRSRSFLESFGSVDAYEPETIAADMTWQHAARNGATLLRERFGRRPGQHHKHVPYALRRSVLEDMCREFEHAFRRLEEQRFRSEWDLSPTSFLYHHYALGRGDAEQGHCRETHVQRKNYRALSRRVESGRGGDFFCLNDGSSGSDRRRFDAFKQRVMGRLFPLPAPWEHAGRRS